MKPLAWPTNPGEILNRDFLPGLAPYVRWLRTPLGSLGLAAVASGLCGMFLHPQGFVVFFGILVVTTLGLVWPWLSVRGLDGSLSFDRSRCREGESVTVRLVLRNRMPWGAWGISIQGGFHNLSRTSHSDIPLVGLAVVPGWRTIEETVEFVPACRGEYPGQPPRVVCGFPFGLWEASRPLDVDVAAAGLAPDRPCRGRCPRREGVKLPTAWRRGTARAIGAIRWASDPTAGATRSVASTGP